MPKSETSIKMVHGISGGGYKWVTGDWPIRHGHVYRVAQKK